MVSWKVALTALLTVHVRGVRVHTKVAVDLPSAPASVLEQPGSPTESAAWWVRDANQVYYAPASSASGLSGNISDYYYALGPLAALTEQQARHRVGGTGRVHIFHAPEGPAALEDPESTKRYALSALSALESGMELAQLPEYQIPAPYRDPLTAAGLQVERAVMNRLTEASYGQYIEELTSSTSGRLRVTTRTWSNNAATTAVVNYLANELRSIGITTCIQTFTPARVTRQVSNVIGLIRGTEGGSVTLGAHFDDLPATGNAPGAVDDGSGTAAVLAMARAFVGAGARPRKSVYFVLFGGEEAGLFGSDRFAAELANPGGSNSPIQSECRVARTTDHQAIIMDMIGWRNPRFPQDTVTLETTNAFNPTLLPPLAMANRVNNAGRLRLLFNGRPFGSDHMSFINRRLAAALTIDNDGDAEAYPCYHRSCDTRNNVNTRLATEITRMNLGGEA